jgi:hypothetical protein
MGIKGIPYIIGNTYILRKPEDAPQRRITVETETGNVLGIFRRMVDARLFRDSLIVRDMRGGKKFTKRQFGAMR